MIIINIGLDVQATRTLSATVAREILVANGFLIKSSTVIQSDTEPTLVASVIMGPDIKSPTALRAAIHQTAVDLLQDCIAFWAPALRHGELIGPRAAAWGGKFNPEFFIDIDGQRLVVEA